MGCLFSISTYFADGGARFVVFLMGKIMTMPGLSKEPAYLGMKFSNSGKISGLY